MQTIRAKIEPRELFMPLFAAECPRFAVVVAHRRSGKTVAAIQRLIHSALTCRQPNPRLAFIAPFRHQAKNVAWDYTKRMAGGFPGTQINEAELRVDLFNGARIQLYGADNPDALRGAYLDGAALDEFAQMDPATWDQVVRPMLSDRKGWALFIGTPMGRNSFAQLYDQATGDGWGRWFLPASETGLIDQVELDAARRDMTPEAYEQEYELSWSAAIRGAFYGNLMEQADKEGRIINLPVIPGAWTMTAWDLGVRDATAIWVIQQDGPWYHAIDYIESSGVGLDWYVRELHDRGYRYDQHIAPHDIAVVELGTGRSRRDVAADLGVQFDTCANHRIMDGISAVRDILPRMRFDSTKCARGIECLRQYRADYNERLGALAANPLHDWSSHGADAARYFAMGRHGAINDEWQGRSPNVPLRKIDDGHGYRRANR